MTSLAAACPTQADLADGIVIKTGKPDSANIFIVRDLGNGLIWKGQHSWLFPDQWQSFHHQGAFLLYTQRDSGTGKKVNTYSTDLPEIVDGATFTALTAWGDPAGAQTWSGELTYSLAARDPVTIGTCVYDALSIKIEGELTYPDGAIRRYGRTDVYLPQLRFTMGSGAAFSVETVGFGDPVIGTRKLRKLAKDEAALADILARYNVGG
ncbi:hypothetical protein [Nereida sp. MMG025]|uniref:hypothetical protein n=1 Tax=Nereida sp. MMG025 TaxID=2909981 RepID=UPI001F27365D|nr:hypothetical protein [Nereida sp. MMG025]MCF6445964.1 hypothetical protein [Nereida sp. MMG025]